MKMKWVAVGMTAWIMMAAVAFAAPAESKRLGLAKDYIADEQWTRAIAQLKIVAEDPKETNRDEALFWLAHSEHQTGDLSAAIQTIARLERLYPKSRWIRPARSLRVEIAQQLRRDDVLWQLAVPPPPPPAPRAATPFAPSVAPPPPPPAPGTHPPGATPAAPPAASTPRPGVLPPPPAYPRPPVVAQPATPPPSMLAPAAARPPMAPRATLEGLLPVEPYPLDTDLRIEAFAGLMESHGERVIPLLREIAFDANSPDEARRALFVLAQSRRQDARNTVAEVARRGPEPVRLVAIREMGRFDDPRVSTELMQVYQMAGTPRVKRQVVSSLGERADNMALLRIARVESDSSVRDTAIVTLGRLPDARVQLRMLYAQAPRASRNAVITALFSAKDEDELIRIAQTEREPLLRHRVREQLRLLGTPKAMKFLSENP
jgi:hypothetical protein